MVICYNLLAMPEDMRTERPPQDIDARQVARVVEQLQREPQATVEGRSVTRIGGGSDKLKFNEVKGLDTDLFKFEEDSERLRDRIRLSGGTAERVLLAQDMETVKRLAREFMGNLEGTLDLPDMQGLQLLHGALVLRVQKYEDAQEEDYARKSGLDKEGLVSTITPKRALQDDGFGNFGMTMTDEEAVVIRGSARQKGVNQFEILERQGNNSWKFTANKDEVAILYRDPQARAVLAKVVLEEKPAIYSTDELKKTTEELRKCAEEVRTRLATTKAWAFYDGNFFSITAIAKAGADYTGISSEQWRDLVSMDSTIPGEITLGDKIDLGMRLHAVIAEGGGVEEFKNEAGKGREERLREAIKGLPEETRKLVEADFKTLVSLAKKNIHTRPPSKMDDVGDVRKWVREIINKGKTDDELTKEGKVALVKDTKAGEEWSWRLFKMWGLAAHFDNRGTKVEEGFDGEFKYTPMGPASSDDMARKAYYFEARRAFEAGESIPHGPDATLGKYPNVLSSTFLHSTLVSGYTYEGDKNTPEGRKLKYTRSLYEIWWNKGKKLRDLPWNRVSDGAWFQYNYQLGYIGREKSGFYALATTDNMERRAFTTGSLRDIHDTVKKAIKDQSVHGGKIENWLANNPEAGELTGREFTEKFIEPIRKKCEELILIGAICDDYGSSLRNDAIKDWGMFVAFLARADSRINEAAEDAKVLLERILTRSGIGIDVRTLELEAKKYLQKAGVKV